MVETSANPMCELHDSGELTLPGDGRAVLAGRALALGEWFDAQFLALARQAGAEEISFPSLVPRVTLERAGYLEAFPQGATRVSAPGMEETHVLAPAVCYQVYAQMAGRTIAAPRIFTCAGRCFRHENAAFHGLARLWEFTMREIVFLGPAGWVAERRREWMERIRAFAALAGLAGNLEPASDPFFVGGAGRGRKLLQQLKELKFELRLELDPAGETLAAASFNLHEDFFGRRFEIRLPGGAAASTGCAAFGLERWVCSFLAQRGAAAADVLAGQASRPVRSADFDSQGGTQCSTTNI